MKACEQLGWAQTSTYADPVYAWAGGGYVSASTFQHYEHDPSRGVVSSGHIAVAGVGIIASFQQPKLRRFDFVL